MILDSTPLTALEARCFVQSKPGTSGRKLDRNLFGQGAEITVDAYGALEVLRRAIETPGRPREAATVPASSAPRANTRNGVARWLR